MINFLGGIVDFAFDMAGMAIDLAMGAIELVFGILGGIASLIVSVFGLALVVLLAVVFVCRHRRRSRKKDAQRSDVLVDENGETFTSFYHQKEE